jgi:hypothetical protein
MDMMSMLQSITEGMERIEVDWREEMGGMWGCFARTFIASQASLWCVKYKGSICQGRQTDRGVDTKRMSQGTRETLLRVESLC